MRYSQEATKKKNLIELVSGSEEGDSPFYRLRVFRKRSIYSAVREFGFVTVFARSLKPSSSELASC